MTVRPLNWLELDDSSGNAVRFAAEIGGATFAGIVADETDAKHLVEWAAGRAECQKARSSQGPHDRPMTSVR